MSTAPYIMHEIRSADGTRIGYREFGHGPGLVLLHGGMQASQNFVQLASALSDQFSVYVPDRRGRGASGPFGDDYGLNKEREDLAALLEATQTRRVFGLSSGAIIALFSALQLPNIEQLALYEPPLPFESARMTWVARYEAERARGDLGAAMVSVLKGTGDDALFEKLPRFILVPLLRLALRHEPTRSAPHIPLRELVGSMHYDGMLVEEMKAHLQTIHALQTPRIFLLGGDRSNALLRIALSELARLVPQAERAELRGAGHIAADDTGKPELVARELRRFFGSVPIGTHAGSQ